VGTGGVKLDHPAPPPAELKNAWSYISTSPILLHGVVLNEAMYMYSWSWYFEMQIWSRKCWL